MKAAEYKATRERLGTQAEVASLLGVNRVTVAKRERGTMTITREAELALRSLRTRKRKGQNALLSGTAKKTPSNPLDEHAQ